MSDNTFDKGRWFNLKRPVDSYHERKSILGPLDRFRARSYDIYTGYQYDLDKYISERLKRRIGSVCDYGSGGGFCGFLISEALDAERLTLMDFTPNGSVPSAEQALIDRSDRISFIPIEKPATFPEKSNNFDLIMANDVLGFVNDDLAIPLLKDMVRSMTQNGMGVVTITDNSSGQRDRLVRQYELIKTKAPELLEKFVFITYRNLEAAGQPEDREYYIMERGDENDLGTQLIKFHEALHFDDFGPFTFR